MKEIDLLKELRNKTLEILIEKADNKPSGDLTEMKLNIMQIKEILYGECLRIANKVLQDDLR